MKKVSTILMLLMAFFMPYAANAYNHQVQVGDGTDESSIYAPINYRYDYSYAQMIYTAAQINEGCSYVGDIESISFYCASRTYERSAPITVYMKTTTKSAFTSSSNWESVTDNDIYYQGDYSVTDAGCWYTITFDRPFVYDGTSNLLIAIYKENNPAETGQEIKWQHTPVSGYQVIYKYGSSALNLSSLGTSTGRKKSIPNIIFNMTLDHPMPTHVTWDDASGSTATFSWTAPQTTNTITHYAYEYNNGMGTTTSTTVILSGLTAEMDDQFQVKAVYSDGGESCWSILDYYTLEDCPTPRNLEANNITAHGAEINWFGSGPDSYTVEVGIPGNTATETFLSEGFEDGELPEGWTRTEPGPNQFPDWDFLSGLNDYEDVYVYAANGAYNAANSSNDDYLITPAMNLSNANSATLSFYVLNPADWDYGDFNTLNVHYRVNGGDWNLLYTIDYEVDSWQPVSIPLQGLAANYQIGFECVNNFGLGTGIDEVEIVGEVSQFTWTNVYNDASKPFALENLTPETVYGVRVNGVCEGEPGEKSEVIIFTTSALPSITKEIIGYNGNEGGYYLIASPVADPITPTVDNGFLTNDYDLYAFDESQELEWRNFEAQSFTQLVSGQGYLYASKTNTTLVFTGEPYNGDGKVTLQKTAGAEFEGWNLVGNPFNDTAYLSRPYYRSDGAVVIDQLETSAVGLMEGVFVIAENNEEEITFSTSNPNSKIAKLTLDLTRCNSLLDRAIVRFDEGRQLPKFQLRKNSTKVFIPQEGKDYAVIRSQEMGAMPVNFKAEENGTYTLSITTEEINFAYLHLIDNMTGNDVDLLATPNYSFEAKTTDYESRFKLVFATGNNANDDAFAFYSNGNFVINNEGEATLQVFDVNGRILNSESINGCANINVKAAAGVYMLRLVNGDNVKVQKVVVR